MMVRLAHCCHKNTKNTDKTYIIEVFAIDG